MAGAARASVYAGKVQATQVFGCEYSQTSVSRAWSSFSETFPFLRCPVPGVPIGEGGAHAQALSAGADTKQCFS